MYTYILAPSYTYTYILAPSYTYTYIHTHAQRCTHLQAQVYPGASCRVSPRLHAPSLESPRRQSYRDPACLRCARTVLAHSYSNTHAPPHTRARAGTCRRCECLKQQGQVPEVRVFEATRPSAKRVPLGPSALTPMHKTHTRIHTHTHIQAHPHKQIHVRTCTQTNTHVHTSRTRCTRAPAAGCPPACTRPAWSRPAGSHTGTRRA